MKKFPTGYTIRTVLKSEKNYALISNNIFFIKELKIKDQNENKLSSTSPPSKIPTKDLSMPELELH